uniref:Uncharacterized protein n=1 Tax=Cyprinodon variegatus TaxID=28743 RepID=A0A3Q2GPC8_CYPVA
MAAEDELQLLRSQLKKSEEQARQAAQAGLDLLRQVDELQERLDEQRVEMTNALEQDKYSLQKEVELKNRMLESLQSEYESVKKQQKQQLEEHQEHLERSHSVALSELQNKVGHQRPGALLLALRSKHGSVLLRFRF